MKPTKAQKEILDMLDNDHQLCIIDMGAEYCSAYIQSQRYLHMTDKVNVASAKALVRHGFVSLLYYDEEMYKHIFVLEPHTGKE